MAPRGARPQGKYTAAAVRSGDGLSGIRFRRKESRPQESLLDLQSVIEYSAQMLPNDGPVSAFVFLNALHAFEHMPFEEPLRGPEGFVRFAERWCTA